jgi:1,6-anhydro-N-acetylmuramate kinase
MPERPARRRRLNPADQRRKTVREKQFRQLRTYADLHTAFIDAMRRDNKITWLRRLAELRALAELMVDQLFPTAPALLAANELEVRDIGEIGKPNFAITHRGKPLVTGFKTQPLCWAYVKKRLCTPATLTIDKHGEIEFSHDDFEGGQKSWTIH